MDDGLIDLKAEARAKAYAMPLGDINVTDIELWRTDTIWPYFERLRTEDPVHLHPAEHHEDGAFWSVTKYNDIMSVDTDHEAFSSEPSITIVDPKEDFNLPMFIAMDPPKHDVQRKTVSPIVSPANLHVLEPLIRERIGKTLDALPIGEPFDWVDRVSIELTTQMLATLFDFPWEDRRKLTRWSDVATADNDSPLFEAGRGEEQRKEELFGCVDYFTRLWNERVNAPPKGDLISMLAHGEATRNMDRMEYLGNLILLIVGGNDTTRNSMTGSVLAMNQILGSGASSRIFMNLREEKGYTYGAYSKFDMKRLGGEFEATAEVRTAVTGDSLREFFFELNRIRDERVAEV